MLTADFERNGGLDDLSSNEFEERAFGPDPDGPRRPRTVLRPRPGETVLSARARSGGQERNRARLLVGTALVVALGVLAARYFNARGPEEVVVFAEDFEQLGQIGMDEIDVDHEELRELEDELEGMEAELEGLQPPPAPPPPSP